MFGSFLPIEGRFFDLFKQSADLLVEAAHEYRAMLSDLKNIEIRSRRIESLEQRADEVTHATIELLHKTFITPLDRQDIHLLISEMDDIVDLIEASAQRMFLYGISVSTPETDQLADICVRSAEFLRSAIGGLENLKNSPQILKDCIEINRLENEADFVLRSAMAKLFHDEPDTRHLIKMKELYELLETVTDRCEDVANTIEGIVLEYA
jgi:uncharacterized protein